jgi:hypothetical protein
MGMEWWMNVDNGSFETTWRLCTTCSSLNWVVLGFNQLILVIITIFVVWNATTGSIVYFLMCGVWLSLDIIQFTYTSFITNTKVLMEFGFYRPIMLIVQHNQYVLVVIVHFSKWLELVPLLNCNNHEGVTFPFLDSVFSRFGVRIEVLTNEVWNSMGNFKNCMIKH